MIKRLTDITVSLILLILLSPVMLITAVGVAAFMGLPVIFRQRRPGLHGYLFTLYKFRSMKDATTPDGQPLSDEERLTGYGVLIRSTSLDELPELFNVLKGDMSLVGPRPLLAEYMARYTPEQARRHNVKPGITGLAQISGRHNLPFSKRLEMDVYYVDHQNLWLDLKILLATLPCVLGLKGVAEGKQITNLHVDDVGIIPEHVTRAAKRQNTDSGAGA